ncbi:MAG: hypothetical protein IPK10_14060 [Bacteroidetes bacterium]|nr:hypothetical protein [Bacteroidota bacterium]
MRETKRIHKNTAHRKPNKVRKSSPMNIKAAIKEADSKETPNHTSSS